MAAFIDLFIFYNNTGPIDDFMNLGMWNSEYRKKPGQWNQSAGGLKAPKSLPRLQEEVHLAGIPGEQNPNPEPPPPPPLSPCQSGIVRIIQASDLSLIHQNTFTRTSSAGFVFTATGAGRRPRRRF